MRAPFPFDHLTLAEVAECERLQRELVGKYPGGSSQGKERRLAELLRKRHRPLYDDEGPRAA